MLRIAFVVYGGLDNVSGGFIYDRALVGALRAAGHEVDVVSLPWRTYPGAVGVEVAVEVAGIAQRCWRSSPAATAPYDAIVEDELVHPSRFLGGRGRTSGGRAPRAPLRLALVHNLRSCQPDGLPEPSKPPVVDPAPTIGDRWRRARRGLLHGVTARIERTYLRGVDGVVAVCARTLADVWALAGDDVPGLVVHPGRDHVGPEIDVARAASRCREPGPLRLLHVAAVRPAKGLARLITAVEDARACGLDCLLDVVGGFEDAVYLRRIRRQIADAGLESRVHLHGQRTGAELVRLFRRGQLFVLPSDREAYSLACLEALGYGLPVVATANGGLGEMVTPGREGLLLDPGDRVAWAAALVRLGGDRLALAAMAEAALARYRAHLTWREAAAAVAAFVAAFMAERRQRLDPPRTRR